MEDSERPDVQETTVSDGPRGRRKVLIPIVAILVIVVGALMAIKSSVQKESRLNLQPVELTEGAELPDFTLTKLDGTQVKVSELPGKVKMLNFWATWCEACMEEMPSIVKLRETYHARGFEVLGLNVDETPSKAVPPTEKKFEMKFSTYMDPNNSLTELFDIHAIPLTVIFGEDRKILMIESGSREWDNEEMHTLVEKWLSP